MNAHTDMTAEAAVAATAAVRAVPVSAALVIATVAPNTKRPGTKAHAAYSLYAVGQTVGDYLRAGGRRVELSWDLERGFVTLASVWPLPTTEPTLSVPEGMADLPTEQEAVAELTEEQMFDAMTEAHAMNDAMDALPKSGRKGKK